MRAFLALAPLARAASLTCSEYFAERLAKGAAEMLPPPEAFPTRDAWWAYMQDVRTACTDGASKAIYDEPALKWTQTSYVQPQVHTFDRFFYDPEHGYTVDTFLADLKARYGGVDSILLWPTYPNIGLDARNQFDLFTALPGGLPALKAAIDQLHERGVKVLLPYNPWDVETHRASGSDPVELGKLRAALGSDGFNGDTMPFVAQEFYTASRGTAIEPEGMGTPDMRTWHTLGWGYWTGMTGQWAGSRSCNYTEHKQKNAFPGHGSALEGAPQGPMTAVQCQDWCDRDPTCECVVHDPKKALCFTNQKCDASSFPDDPNVNVYVADCAKEDNHFTWISPKPPQVDFYKFAFDARWMTHGCERWNKNHTDFLQTAFFNGVGFESWENVWGAWNGIVPRDAELLRRMSHIQRFFGQRGLLTSAEWMPHSTDVAHNPPNSNRSIYGSKFPGDREAVYLLVNRDPHSNSTLVHVEGMRHAADCYSGQRLTIDKDSKVNVTLEAGGIGCVFVSSKLMDFDSGVRAFLSERQTMTALPLYAFPDTWTYLGQSMVTMEWRTNSTGMVEIPGTDSFRFLVSSVQVEGDDAHGVDVQFPWEEHPAREHDHAMSMPTFYIDQFPVTNAEYAAYLKATGYAPKDPTNFLKLWNHSSGKPEVVKGHEKKPVTSVGLEEARAYCAWRGARLPHSYEWQYAAQGTDGRIYPWGSYLDQSRLPAAANNTNEDAIPDDVDAHPSGASPFGVQDLVGNVWQYTDEFQDIHTRAVVLRGGSRYDPHVLRNEEWDFPPALELNKHNKYFLMSDSYERATSLGFRCAADEGGRVQYV